MEEKTNIELLKDFAKSTNRTIEIQEIPYPVSGIRKFQKFKRMIYVPNNFERTSFFVWYSDPYARVGVPTILCGAVIPISSSVKSKINIRSRNIIDKVNVFSKASSGAIGKESFDSKVVLSGSIDSGAKRLLSQARTQDQLLKALKIEPFINISINEYNLDFVPELKGKSHVSIINPQSWYFEKKEIEALFSRIEKIRNQLD
jgi:hypothetical protein